ncbi:uncharacterized protein LOC144619449 [Crassostrea virginica]
MSWLSRERNLYRQRITSGFYGENMAYLLLIGTVVAVVVIVLLIGVAVTMIWCCCRKKRVSIPNKCKSKKGAHAEEKHYEVISDVNSVSKTANSGFLYINTVPSENTE